MFLKNTTKMLLWLFFLGTVLSAPMDEFQAFVNNEELALNDEAYIKYIVPSGYSPQKSHKQSKLELSDIVNKDNEYYEILKKHVVAGNVKKGLTFSIYDDNMRDAAIALFRLLQYAEVDQLNTIKEWALENINHDILEYALRMVSLYRNDAIKEQEPPFVSKPNYFINSETINKALKLKINNGKFDPQESSTQQFYRTDDIISINTNYSGWNLLNEECKDKLDYFREDIGLNSYYYGVHLQFPFWMTNDELNGIDPKYTEQYYYIHKQLMARYQLEKEHVSLLDLSSHDSKCYDDYIPYLSYENGLNFAIRSTIRREMSQEYSRLRSTIRREMNEEYSRLRSIDIAINECISRGFIFMENNTKTLLNEDNYVNLLSKLIRTNYESIPVAKIIRSLFGYGGKGYFTNTYNPAPSVLHHPQTTLRDPIYWYIIQTMLNYFSEFSKTLEPYNFSQYQTEEFSIIDNKFSKMITYYEHYSVSLNKIFDKEYDFSSSSLIYTARQKRLKHLPFNFEFNVNSKSNQTCLVKLFLGPKCDGISCWNEYSKFFELDAFPYHLEEGLNLIKWSPDTSNKYSFDDYFNVELKSLRKNRFDLFKFPENMIIPKGIEQGLNFTLFILLAPTSGVNELHVSSQPLGFPFHRQPLVNNSLLFNNYKFYNISIYHKEINEIGGYYSKHLN